MPRIPTFRENKDWLLFRSPSPGSIVPLTSGGTSTGGATQAPTSNQTAITPETASQPSYPTPASSGSAFDLFGGFGPGIESARTGLEGLTSSFYDLAGENRTWEDLGGGLGGANELHEYLSDPTASNIEAAKGIVSAGYSGPSGLDQEAFQKLYADISSLGEEAEALGSGYGLRSLLQQQTPGLTGGEASHEAQRLLSDPEYQQRQREQQRAVQGIVAAYGQAQEQAGQYAKTREESESEIAKRGTEYLTQQRNQLLDTLETLAAERNAEREAAQEAWQNFSQTGAPSGLDQFQWDLGTVPEQLLNPQNAAFAYAISPKSFQTPYHEQARLAEEAFSDLQARYADLSSTPYGSLTSQVVPDLNQGDPSNEWRGSIMPDYYGEGRPLLLVRSDGTIEETQPYGELGDAERRLQERQREAQMMFSGGGPYTMFNPMYFGQAVGLPEAVNYITPPAMAATTAPQGVATSEQVDLWNAIDSILGGGVNQWQEMAAAESPMFKGDLAAFLADTEAAVNAYNQRIEGSPEQQLMNALLRVTSNPFDVEWNPGRYVTPKF